MKTQQYQKWLLVASIYILILIGCKWVLYNSMSLSIQYQANNPGAVQIFYDNLSSEYPFDENYSERVFFDQLNGSVAVNIPFENIGKIRVDFEGVNTEIVLESIKVKILGITAELYTGQKLVDAFNEISDAKITIDKGEAVIYSMGADAFIINKGINSNRLSLIIYSLSTIGALIISGMTVFVLSHSIPVELKKLLFYKKKQITLISLFIGYLVIPTIVGKMMNETVNIENRALKEKPEFSIETIGSYPQEYEAYYDDNLPLKNFFIKINSYVKYELLNMSPQKYVIKGQDDWLFYDSMHKEDADTIADYKGMNHYSQEELEHIKSRLLEKRDYLESQGIEFYVLIAPNKSRIYSQYMPDYYYKAEKSKTDVLVEYLQEETDIQVVYPKEVLLTESERYQTYFKLDTHWNEIGGYIATQELMRAIQLDYTAPELNELKITTNPITYGDLAGMISVNGWVEDTSFVVDGYREDITVNLIEQEGIRLNRFESDNDNNKKLLMFRDSFATAMIPYINKEFTESIFLWSHEFDKSLIEVEKPDVVVIEVVERLVDGAVR